MVDIPERQIKKSTDVKVRIAYSAVCGSDLHDVNGDFDNLFREEFEAGKNIGHEASGYVVELGQEATVKKLKVGDKVSLYYNNYCGKCHYCRIGKEHLCENIDVRLGFMSDYVVLDEQMVFKQPYNANMKQCALAEPISICLHGVDMCHIKPGYTVAVSGGGGIGNITMQLARMSGACRLTLFEPIPWKRQTALDCGADHVLDPLAPNFEAEAREITDGRGFDIIFECSGAASSIVGCYSLLARGGTLELMALFKPEITLSAINQFDAMQREATIIAGVFQSPYTMERAVELVRKLDTKALTSAIFEPENFLEGFRTQKEGKCLKTMFHFSD
jgi:(R,R)-butanediol dehydrogenase/meso-butanediol dehydrogenase/diacetyl reductase/L-iditol 2-dehydrogenase